MPQFTDAQKAAMGFIDHAMGTNPAGDQLDGMSGTIDQYANDNGVNPQELRGELDKMLPPSAGRPQYQHDAASGAVSDGTKKVYGERVEDALLRAYVRENLMAQHGSRTR